MILLIILMAATFLAFSWWNRKGALADANAAIEAWATKVAGGETFPERAPALEELDDRVQASRSLAMLQRLTVMAPLLGVIITAWELMRLDTAGRSGESMSEILGTVQPLFAGVFAGAILSIVNQVVVVRCLALIRARRDEAVDALDSDAFEGSRTVGEVSGAELVKGARALRTAIATLTQQSRKLSTVQEQLIEQGTGSMNELLASCHELQTRAASLELPRVEQLDQASDRIGDAVRGLAEAMEQADSVLRTQVGEQYRALQDARDTLDERLTTESEQANERFREAAKTFVDKTAAAAKRMEGAVDRLNDRIEKSLGEAVENLSTTFREAAAGETERFKGQAEQIAAAVTGMTTAAGSLESLSGSLERISGSFDAGARNLEEQERIAARFGETSSTLSDASDRLVKAVSELEAKGVGRLSDAAENMKQVATTVVPALQTLSKTPETLRETLAQLERSAKQSTAVLERVENFTSAAAKSAEQIATQPVKRGWFARGGPA